LTNSIQERRVRYVKAGYEPLPCIGKRPAPAGWQALSIDVDVPAAWSASFPVATNTGIRTRRTPAVDIDVRDAAVADQLESALRASFPSALVRFGMPPKRLIPFRCETPFKKIAVSFKSPDNVTHKVEVLGDGQQFIADGIHPDTGKPYAWRDGADLLSVAHEHLPMLDEAAARRFVAEASAIMTVAGWQVVGKRRRCRSSRRPPTPIIASR
jgi:bifunctional DNA primase/polymerase-like protein